MVNCLLYLLAMEELLLTPVAVERVYGGRYEFHHLPLPTSDLLWRWLLP